MKYLLGCWQRLSSIGLGAQVPKHHFYRLISFNNICLIAVGINCLTAVVNNSAHHQFLFIMSVVYILLSVFCLWLTAIGFSLTSRVLFLTVVNVGTSLSALAIGAQVQIQYFLLVVGSLSFLIFHHEERIWSRFFSLLSAGLFLALCRAGSFRLGLEPSLFTEQDVIANQVTYTAALLLTLFALTKAYDRSVQIIEENMRQIAEIKERMMANELELTKSKSEILSRDLELTGAVQRFLIPTEKHIVSQKFELAADFRPATESGGDWWWYRAEGNKLRLLLADVTGHGAGPAMITASATTLANILYDPSEGFEVFLTKLKDRYWQIFNKSEYWMTVTAADFDFDRKIMKSYYASGYPGLAIDREGNTSVVSAAGNPLGMAESVFGHVETQLSPGQRIIFASDGVYEGWIEATGRSEMQMHKSIVESTRALSAAPAVAAIIAELDSLRGKNAQSDDYTLVLVEVK